MSVRWRMRVMWDTSLSSTTVSKGVKFTPTRLWDKLVREAPTHTMMKTVGLELVLASVDGESHDQPIGTRASTGYYFLSQA